METFITNPGKKKRGKSRQRGSRKNPRRNPAIIPNTGKRRGKSRGMRRNPGFGTVIPGGLGGLGFRALLKLGTGDEGIRGTDGQLTTKALGIGALALYFGDKLAGLLKQTGSDGVAFEGGMAGVAACYVADDKMPDLSRQYLAPMLTPAAATAPTGAGNGIAGATTTKPLSLAAYQALAGMGALPAIGAVVYVQGADGAVYEVPTGATSGPGETVTIPEGVQVGQVIRNKRTGARYRIGRDSSTGAMYAEQIGMSGSVSDYQNAA
jgi:hypothetical protein